jgi:anti-sigma regulatory factor (Ser/Thr protein kinase)
VRFRGTLSATSPERGTVAKMPSSNTIRLVLRNDLAELKRLAGWIEDWSQHPVSPDLSFAVQLCLEEAVANVMMHCAGSDDRVEIAIELERSGGTLVACIEDSGPPFDPTQVPPPPLTPSLEEVNLGELGIHLMRSFASGVHYRRRDGRNRLTLHFVESQPPARSPLCGR